MAKSKNFPTPKQILKKSPLGQQKLIIKKLTTKRGIKSY